MKMRDVMPLSIMVLLLAASVFRPVEGQQPFGGTPSGAIVYRNNATCWPGWTELTAARGYYIVGLQAGGTLATATGTPLTNLENRPVGQHTHVFTGIAHTHNLFTPNAGGGNNQLATTGGNGTWGNNLFSEPNSVQSTTAGGTNANTGAVAGTNAPYLELLVCQKN